MSIDWSLVLILFVLSVPGVLIAMTRLVNFLLPKNSESLRKRASYVINAQLLFTVLVMIIAGAYFSESTGLSVFVPGRVVNGQTGLAALVPSLLPVFLYTLAGFVVFCCLYYGLARSFLDAASIDAMTKLRSALRLDGCMLFGGVVEEMIGRWGLMNLVLYGTYLFTKQISTNFVMISAIIFSGLFFAVAQAPVYIAAGYTPQKRYIYVLILLSLCQSLLFGFLFWQYGLVTAILAHMIFHLFWAIYEPFSPT